jgi:hypothetical protein
MTTPSNARRFTLRKALLASTAAFGFLAILALGGNAQEAKKDKAPDDKPEVRRSSIAVSGYTRPGNPDDKITDDGEVIRRVGFDGEGLKKFKIMGGTVYFAVFKNTGLVEGDTFGTGLASFDAKFETGRSFKDSMSPRYDKKAKYLYLYQIVNDRTLDPRINQVKGQKGGGVSWPVFDPKKVDPKAMPPLTEDIASFSLKLITDPRYITSWGHFRDSSFAANVVDVDGAGKPVKNIVDDGKGNKVEKGDKIIHLAFSYLPAIVTELSNPAFGRRARSYSLGVLETGFGVDQGSLNIKDSKAYGDIKLIADQGGPDKTVWASFAEHILKATDAVREPEYVQLMYLSSEERAALEGNPLIPGSELFDDEITRAIFRVDFRKANLLKEGSRSVVFGFTTDLPPTSAPVRIDTSKAAALSEGMRLANYFSEEGMARGIGAGQGTGIALTAGGADGAALALSLGTALGAAASPVPGSEPGVPGFAPGFAGMTGGMSGLGGTTTGGGGGGIGLPAMSGGYSRAGGGGFGGGTGSSQGTPTQTQGQTGTQSGTQTGTQSGSQTINFNATLTNTQTQNQAQSQFQIQAQAQLQLQNQNNHPGHGHPGHHGHHGHHGHVVPAPASLLLGLLGFPGLLLLRRRKNAETQNPEMVA